MTKHQHERHGSARRANSASSVRKQHLHDVRQRHWLKNKGRFNRLEFTDEERAELKKAFEVLAGGREKMPGETLEELLMLLNVVNTVQDARQMTEVFSCDGFGDITFDEFLKMLMKIGSAEGLQVLNSMIGTDTGKLEFHSTSLAYRRKLILDASGATAPSKATQDRGIKVSKSLQALQTIRDSVGVGSFGLPALPQESSSEPADDESASLGNLLTMWKDICRTKELVSHHSEAIFSKPLSPREIIANIVRTVPAASSSKLCRTIVIHAPRLD